jgi:SpoVK/Ycf46/Vps4 family AAA+-type ATPase
LHPDTLARLRIAGTPDAPLRISLVGREDENKEQPQRSQTQPQPSLYCTTVIADASAAPNTVVLPLASANLLRWAAGTPVRLEFVAAAAATSGGTAALVDTAQSGSASFPLATRVHMQVWPPLRKIEWRAPSAAGVSPDDEATHTADAAATATSPLAPLFLEQLQASFSLLLTSPPTAAASSPSFIVLQWRNLPCLARVNALFAADANTSDSAHKREQRVLSARIGTDTKLHIEVQTQPPVFALPSHAASASSLSAVAAVQAAAAPLPSPPRALFPHLRVEATASSSSSSFAATAAAAAAPSVAACFPHEWRALNQFVHNAIQAYNGTHGSAASAQQHATAATSSVAAPANHHPQSAFGLSWGVPRALLLSGVSGSGASRLLRHLESQALTSALVVRRARVTELLAESLALGAEGATVDDDVFYRRYNALMKELNTTASGAAAAVSATVAPSSLAFSSDEQRQPATPQVRRRTGVLLLEDLDSIICGSSYPRLSAQLLALLERLAAPSRLSGGGGGAESSVMPPPPLLLVIASVKDVDSVPSHFLSSGRFDAQLRMRLLSKQQRADLLRQNVIDGLRGQHVQLHLDGMPPPPVGAASSSSAVVVTNSDGSHPPLTDTNSTPLLRLCEALSQLTPGFVAADLSKLVQYALLHAARRWDAQPTSSQGPSGDAVATATGAPTGGFALHWSDFASALARTHPSAQGDAQRASMRFHAEETTKASSSAVAVAAGASATPAVVDAGWPLVAGYPALKRRLALTLHHWLHPSSVSALGLRPISGVLFHGVSGSGKSLWASSLARHASFNFLELSVATLLSQWLGESEAKLRAAFRQAAQLAPCVLLLDQLESMAGKRDLSEGGGGDGGGAAGVDARILSTLLNELDGVDSRRRAGVYVVACCRRLSSLDAPLLRPGRFDDVIEVTLPDAADRAAILRLQARSVSLAPDAHEGLDQLAQRAAGLTAADLRDLLSRAGMHALREDAQASAVQLKHLERALSELTIETTAAQ